MLAYNVVLKMGLVPKFKLGLPPSLLLFEPKFNRNRLKN
jgi:hypothetical protein